MDERKKMAKRTKAEALWRHEKCSVWCDANALIPMSRSGLQSRLDGFNSRPRLYIL
jgi:hypothetical protein